MATESLIMHPVQSQQHGLPVENLHNRTREAVEYYKQRQATPTYGIGYEGISQSAIKFNTNNRITPQNKITTTPTPSDWSTKPPNFQRAFLAGNEPIVQGKQRATFHGTQSIGKRWVDQRKRLKEQQERNHVNMNPSGDLQDMANSHSSQHKQYGRRGLMHRSNSNLELDNLEVASGHNTSAHRDFGSTSSLDLLGMSNNGESFFSLVKDYHDLNTGDQRSHAPAKIQDILMGTFLAGDNKANGSVPVDRDETDSPKVKTKSKHKDRKTRAKSITGEGSANIFKKLRGNAKLESADSANKGDNVSDNESQRQDDQLRKRSFVHYDCQSMGFNLLELICNKSSGFRRRNTTTGASAASANRNHALNNREDPDLISEVDDGDNKCNSLVTSCPFFRNELGGEEERTIGLSLSMVQKGSCRHRSDSGQNPPGSKSAISYNYVRPPQCSGVAVLDTTLSPNSKTYKPVIRHRGHVIEYVDHGAAYYRDFFQGTDHQSFFGIDDNLGPVAVSVRRDRVDDQRLNKADGGSNYQYRIIFRTSELTTLRGCILEDAIPSPSRLSSSRGVPAKDVLEYVLPEVQLAALKMAVAGAKTEEQLIKLDEQGVPLHYKVGIMYCKAGQSTEEEMYNNESASPAFDEFLTCIGQKVRLKAFDKYRAQLDNKTDSTGTHSLYTTFNGYEIMFHVSTMLPYTTNNKQQLLRKRHIGNDIVTVVFQEVGAKPFSARSVRSHFQHVFIIVQAHNPNTENVHYSVAVSRSKDVPPFGPPIPEGAVFSKSQEFADFLLAKVINAENAAHRSEKFMAMATRTRQEYLKDLATNHTTSTTLESGSKLSKFSLGSGRKKEKNRPKVTPDHSARGGIIWNIQAEDFGESGQISCQLGIAACMLVLIDDHSKSVIFTVSTDDILGWTPQTNTLRLYYDRGECVVLKTRSSDSEELHEICTRLSNVSAGIETREMTLKRNGMGQLGFHVHPDGLISDVEPYSFAWIAGLRQGGQLVEICKITVATLTHDQMIDLLRTSAIVKVVFIPPREDGTPRRPIVPGFHFHTLSTATSTSTHRSNHSDYSSFADDINSSPSPQSAYSLANIPKSSSPRLSFRPSLGLSQTHTNLTSQYSHRSPSDEPPITSHGPEPRQRKTSAEGIDNYLPPRPAAYTDGYTSSGDERHSRNSSRDSTDYLLTGPRPWRGGQKHVPSPLLSPSGPQSYPGTRWLSRSQQENSPPGATGGGSSSTVSGDITESYHGSYNTITSSSGYNTSGGPYSTPWKASRHTDFYVTGMPSTGNISSELQKQHQNTKYLLSHTAGEHSRENSGAGSSGAEQPSNSSSNLSDLSASSGSTQTHDSDPPAPISSRDVPPSISSRDPALPLSSRDRHYMRISIGDDVTLPHPQRVDMLTSNSKGRPVPPVPAQRQRQFNASPISSGSSSPRPSHKNLSGMSSDESLSVRLRPGVTTPVSKTQIPAQKTEARLVNSKFEDELKRLINPEETSLKSVMATRASRLPRALSDESIHSLKDNLKPPSSNAEALRGSNDALSSSSASSYRMNRDHRVVTDGSSVRMKTSTTGFPLPTSTTGIEWSSLVDVASRALDVGPEIERPIIPLRLTDTEVKPVPPLRSGPYTTESSLSSTGHSLHLTQHDIPSVSTSLKSELSGLSLRLPDLDGISSSPSPRSPHLQPEPSGLSLHIMENDLPSSFSQRSVKRMELRQTDPDTPSPLLGSLSHRTEHAEDKKSSSGSSGYRSATTTNTPYLRIHDLEKRVQQMETDLTMEREENANLRTIVEDLRSDNVRLQDESQAAAAQLRRFTEWFFSTIDRN